jgi:hypothetical protein
VSKTLKELEAEKKRLEEALQEVTQEIDHHPDSVSLYLSEIPKSHPFLKRISRVTPVSGTIDYRKNPCLMGSSTRFDAGVTGVRVYAMS